MALPDPFLDDPLDLGVTEPANFILILRERKRRKATRQLERPRKRGTQFSLRGEGEGPPEVRGWRHHCIISKFVCKPRRHPSMLDCEKPRRSVWIDTVG